MTKNHSQEDAIRQYLTKHLEPGFKTEEQEELLRKFDDQLKKPEKGIPAIEYQTEGVVEYKIKDLEITFSYKEVPEEDFARVIAPPEIGEMALTWDHERSHWRLLTACKIKKGMQVLNIAEFIPKNYSVLIHVNPENKESAYFSPKRRAITMPYNLRKIKSIVALLHEIGHLQDYERLETQEDKKRFEFTASLKEPSQWKDVIQQERNAAAFALKTYKPFLDDDIVGKDDIMQFTHEVLQTYSDKIKVRMVAYGWKTDADEVAGKALEKEQQDKQWINDLVRELKEVL